MKIRRTRESYIREGFEKIHEDENCVIYGKESICLGFHGKASHPDFYYSFRSADQKAEWIRKYINDRATVAKIRATVAKIRAERNARNKAEREAFRLNVKAGAILYRTWGYEQTNADFYKVIKITDRTITIRKLKEVITELGFMSGTAVPFTEEIGGISPWAGPEAIIYNTNAKLSVWDGKPVRISWYG
jgi:hypothetical protein